MPTHMTLSPMQRDSVTREEFGEFKEEVSDRFDEMEVRFDKVDARFDGLDARFEEGKDFTRGAFEGLDRKIDFVEKNLGDKIDKLDSKVTNMNLSIDSLTGDVSWIKRSMGKLMKKAGVS